MVRALNILLVVAVFVSFRGLGAERDLPESKGKYVLILPAGHDPKGSYDAVVALHGAGDTATNFTNFWAPQLKGRSTVLAVPEAGSKAGPGFSWSTEDLPKIIETIKDLTKNYGVDPRRILLTGHSAGCFIGFYAISKEPDLFACFGGTAAGVDKRLVPDKALQSAAGKVAVYYAVGKKDPNYPLFAPGVEQMTKLKFDLMSEDPDIGHTITPEECTHMLAHFDAVCDKSAKSKLDDGKKLSEAKKWGAAEKLLAGVAGGKGPSAAEAKKLLEPIRKDFTSRLEAAKTLGGPEGIEALRQLQKDFAGSALADDAKAAEEAMAKDPKTASIGEQRRAETREKKAQDAFEAAAAIEKAGKLTSALEAYDRVFRDFADTKAGVKAVEESKRLKVDPKLQAAAGKADADRLVRLLENLLKNGATDQAKEKLEEILKKYPDSDAARKAKQLAAELK